MEIVEQRLELLDWPLKNVGDEHFFGYIVAMGLIPGDPIREIPDVPYADFNYNDKYTRYRLPSDDQLVKMLAENLIGNIWEFQNCDSYSGKLWVTLNANGYHVDLP